MRAGGQPSSSYFAFLFCCVMTLSLAAAARAATFEIVSHEATVDVAQQRTAFSLTFNQPPDFFGVSEDGQPRHAFQYFYDADPVDGEVDLSGDDVVIIRGGEIRFGNTIPVRESLNPTGEEFPNAEGWGQVLGEVEYELLEQTLWFSVDFSLLRETDERFGYRLFALQNAELTSEFTFISPRVLVPLPPALLSGGLALAAALRFRRI